MPEEIEGQQPVETQPESTPVQPPESAPQIDDNERRTWEGRLRTEQERQNMTRQSLQSMGMDVDEYGRVYPIQQQPGYQQPTEQPQEEEFEWTPQNIRNMIQAEAAKMVGNAVQGLMPVLDRSLTPSMAAAYQDFNEINQDAVNILRQMGYQGIAHAQAVNPAHLEIAIQAARGKRAATAPPPAPNPTQEQMAAAALAGGGSTSAGGAVKLEVLSAEDWQTAQALGYKTEREAVEAMNGPVFGGRGGK